MAGSAASGRSPCARTAATFAGHAPSGARYRRPRNCPGVDGSHRSKRPAETTALFRFQVQKTSDPKDVYERGLALLQADYFQQPGTFSDRLTALLPGGSALATTLLAERACILEFDQFRQVTVCLPVSSLPSRRSGSRGHDLAQPALQSVIARRCPGAGLQAGLGPGRGDAGALTLRRRHLILELPVRSVQLIQWMIRRRLEAHQQLARQHVPVLLIVRELHRFRNAHPAIDIAVEDRGLTRLEAHMHVLEPVQIVPTHEFHIAA